MACPDRLDRALSLLLPPAFWLGVWQLGAWLVELHVEGRGNELLLPYPATVLLALLRLARSPGFWWTALASLARIAAGMAGGAALGGLLAALTCASPWCRRLFAPVIRIVRATPVVSFILLVLLWTGRDQVPAVIAGLMVLPVVWENLTQGIRAADGQLLELARAYRINPATAAKGINLLVASGVLYKRRGIGMFVAPGAAEAVKAQRRGDFYESYVLPLVREARSLDLSEAAMLDMVRKAFEEGV